VAPERVRTDDRRVVGLFSPRFIALALIIGSCLDAHVAAQTYLVRDGNARSVIVVGEGARGLCRYSAEELQKYIGQLTGVRPMIVAARDVSKQPKDSALLLIGGPESNELVEKAAEAGKINLKNLKPEGFVLNTITVDERAAVVIAGNDEAGTLYGTYDWLERQGIVFQITNDIIPNHRDSLPLDHLDVRSEPAFSQRGFGIASCYETRSIWSYADIVKSLDQMAKMKFNFLIWHMFSPEPYLEYSYQGEKKRMGDSRDWRGGYLLPTRNFAPRQVEDYFEGKEAFQKFGKKYLAPDEWQGVQDEDEVYARAQDLLQRVIHYAKTRNIKVWVAVESLDELETNMARYARRAGTFLPFNPFHGTAVCPTDPVVYELNGLRLKALLATYPEAEGYIFWMPEHYPVCDDPQDKELLERERPNYASVETLIRQTRPDNMEPRMVDNSIGMVHLMQKVVEVRDQIAPQVKLGVGMWGRAFLLPTLDRVLPKDVLLVDNETSGVYTPSKGVPMQLFGGMRERDRIFMHITNDDTGMIGMQFNVRLYYHDRMLEGAFENQVTGQAPLGDRFRGEDHLAKYLSDGTWNPHLTPDQFYHDYARRIFGERAAEPMFQAFMALEDKEGAGGYHANKPTDMACCGPTDELRIAQKYAAQPNPYDGPTFKGWIEFIGTIPHRLEVFSEEVQFEERALEYMKTAEAVAAPGSLDELHYLENKTQAYTLMLRSFIQLDQAFADFDQAFRLDPRTQREEFVKRLDASLQEFQKAEVLARSNARIFAEVVDSVSDLGVLWRLNTYGVAGTEQVAKFIENIDDYHHGKPYLNPVEWGKVFVQLPLLSHEY
jgi:tetratricopeptide (TPR) repeat protein